MQTGTTRGWPTTIDPFDIRQRIFSEPMHSAILALILKPAALAACPIWTDFLLAINYSLFEFNRAKTKAAYSQAIRQQSRGYYGPLGAFIIGSRLMRFIAVNEEKYLLEQRFFGTLMTIVGQDPHFGGDMYNDYDDSNHMPMKDFVAFVLVPFVAICLIAQDFPALGGIQGAIFERNNSSEYGDLVHPDDDADDRVHQLHHENIKVIKGLGTDSSAYSHPAPAQKKQLLPPLPPKDGAVPLHPPPAKKNEKNSPVPPLQDATAPPRHRKKVEPLKIRLPPYQRVEEEEITIEDFAQPNPKTKKTPGPKKEKKEQKEKKGKDVKREGAKPTPSRRSTRSNPQNEDV
ncbi:hypothetical protein B0H13DRAFT_2010707 [Mycena leptocephala]|nr:hypothetical protein B0H13DRAFT_2010707 [Mycena leptocephala]